VERVAAVVGVCVCDGGDCEGGLEGAGGGLWVDSVIFLWVCICVLEMGFGNK
jgi:hypothetical protein